MAGENKKITIVNKETGEYVRTPKSLAQQYVNAGTHYYVSKGNLRKFINREQKLESNIKMLSKSSKIAAPATFKDEKGRLYKIVNGKRIIYSYGNS